MRHPKRLICAGIVVLAVTTLAACSGSTTAGQAVATGQTAISTSAAPQPVAVVTATPALGDQQLAPAGPLTITVAKGTISH